jgi:hypothetical protein
MNGARICLVQHQGAATEPGAAQAGLSGSRADSDGTEAKLIEVRVSQIGARQVTPAERRAAQ